MLRVKTNTISGRTLTPSLVDSRKSQKRELQLHFIWHNNFYNSIEEDLLSGALEWAISKANKEVILKIKKSFLDLQNLRKLRTRACNRGKQTCCEFLGHHPGPDQRQIPSLRETKQYHQVCWCSLLCAGNITDDHTRARLWSARSLDRPAACSVLSGPAGHNVVS